MVEINNDTLLLIAGLAIGIIIIKLLGKFVFRLVGVAVLAIFLLTYTYFYTDFFVEHKENKVVQAIEKKIEIVSIMEYQKKHCNGVILTRNDSITCECIVEPLVKDMKERLSKEEIKALDTNKQLCLKELMTSLKRNEKEIQFNLKERNAIYLWNKMVLNLKQGKMIGDE
jgi:hypothetical protein